MVDVQEEWSLKHKDKASAASMERVQHFGEAFAKIQEATGALHWALLPAGSYSPLSAVGARCFCPWPPFEVGCFCPLSLCSAHRFCPVPLPMPVVSALSLSVACAFCRFPLLVPVTLLFENIPTRSPFPPQECEVTDAGMSSSSSCALMSLFF